MMTSLGAIAILSSQVGSSSPIPDWGWSLAILVAYTFTMFLMSRFERREYAKASEARLAEGAVDATVVGDSTLRSTLRRVAFYGFCVVLSGIGLVYLADELAEYEFSFGKLGHTFVGTIGLALATSLPELVVGATAVRMKKFDLAIGNIFGSNIFNILVLAICQIAYTPFHSKSFFAEIHSSNLITAFLATALSGIAIAGLVYQSRRSMLRLGWDTAAICVLFVAGMYLVFLMGR
jgi:cation:H+ antiporter